MIQVKSKNVSTLRLKRVPVPVNEAFRQIAKSERRSIAAQAAIVLEQFAQVWPKRAVDLKPNNATKYIPQRELSG
jgi:hypothetical protein